MTRVYLAAVLEILRTPAASDTFPDMIRRVEALEGCGVRLADSAAEKLAKEMQIIVAADRWKGSSLDATPPEKWHRLRPETQRFWIDTAARILAALEPVAQPETPTPGQFTTMCLAIEDVVMGRGFDVAIPEEVKAHMRNVLMVGGWRVERE